MTYQTIIGYENYEKKKINFFVTGINSQRHIAGNKLLTI